MDEKIRILVVDDTDALRMGTARVLRQAGYAVEEAATGRECLEKVRRTKPDLLLLDVNLPDMIRTLPSTQKRPPFRAHLRHDALGQQDFFGRPFRGT